MKNFIVIYDRREEISDVFGIIEANSAEEALTQVGLKVDGINIYSIYCYELASDEIFFK